MATSNAFIDSNVWLYAFIKAQDPTKTAKATQLINTIATIFISPQVINEVCVNLIKKENTPESDIRDFIDDFYALYQVIELQQAQLRSASQLRERYNVSYWDSLIVVAAITSGTTTIYSEDMQDGLQIDNRVTIVNPFK